MPFANSRHNADNSSVSRLVYQSAEGTVPSTFNGKDVEFRPKHEQMEMLDSHVFEFTLSETGGSNDVEVCPVQFFVKEIESKKNNGNVKAVRTYPEANYFISCGGFTESKQSTTYKKQMGLNDEYWTDGTIKAGSTRKFYLRFWESEDEFINTYVKKDKGYTQITLTLADSVKSGGSGTVGISDIRLISKEIRIPPKIRAGVDQPNRLQERRTLWWHEVRETAQVLTASTETEIDLNKIKGDCPFLLLAIRDQNYSATNSTNHQFHALGDGALINVKSYDKELLSLGSDMPIEYLQHNIWSEHLDTAKFAGRNLYLIPFCRSVKLAIQGSKNGYHRFDGSRKNVLHIKPGAAGTSQVQTINLNNAANDGGYYQLSFKGDITDALAYNANAAAIKAALEALPSFKNYPGKPLTVTASGAATTDFTLTFDSEAVPPTDLVQLIPTSLNDGTVADYASTAITTEGKQGWTTATVDLRVYAPIFRKIDRKGGVYRAYDM